MNEIESAREENHQMCSVFQVPFAYQGELVSEVAAAYTGIALRRFQVLF